MQESSRGADHGSDLCLHVSLYAGVEKMASHAIFQYNVLAIDDIHNTWTNMIVKMTILRLLGSSDDKKKLGIARPDIVNGIFSIKNESVIDAI